MLVKEYLEEFDTLKSRKLFYVLIRRVVRLCI